MFYYREEDYLDAFVEKMNKILGDLAYFPTYVILPKIAEKFKSATFYVLVRILKMISFCALKKVWKRIFQRWKLQQNLYPLKFINSARFMIASLDSLVIKISDKIYHKKSIYGMDCKDCKKWEDYKSKKIE